MQEAIAGWLHILHVCPLNPQSAHVAGGLMMDLLLIGGGGGGEGRGLGTVRG